MSTIGCNRIKFSIKYGKKYRRHNASAGVSDFYIALEITKRIPSMKIKLILSLLGGFLTAGLFAQDCQLYYPSKENAQLGYNQYDKKGNLSGSSLQKITSLKSAPGSTVAEITSESFDAKGKSMGTVKLTARCESGVYFIDMKNYMGAQSTDAYKDMEMSVEGGNLEMPLSLKAGDVLKDGNLKMSFSSGGMTIMNMTIAVTNRKVEAVENITTPAGTFECCKITYDIATKMMINVKMKGVEWYAKNVGLVKSESYSTDGKLMGSSQLSVLK